MSSLASPLPRCEVWSASFFAPEYATLRDALELRPRETRVAPKFELVTGRLRRFTSLVTQMHLEVSGHALTRAKLDPREVRPLFASQLGETGTTLELLQSITDQNVASAARFAQSVHSTPSGLFSIATGNRHGASAVAAGSDTFSAALLEARLVAAETRAPVLLSIADDELPALLGSARPGAALALAFVLSVQPRAGSVGLPEELPAAPDAPHLQGSALLPAMALALHLFPDLDA